MPFTMSKNPSALPDVRKIVGEATQKAALKRENASLRAALDQSDRSAHSLQQSGNAGRAGHRQRGIAATDLQRSWSARPAPGAKRWPRHIPTNGCRGEQFVAVDTETASEEARTDSLARARSRGCRDRRRRHPSSSTEIATASPAIVQQVCTPAAGQGLSRLSSNLTHRWRRASLPPPTATTAVQAEAGPVPPGSFFLPRRRP